MEQIVAREKKSFIKILTILLLLVVGVDILINLLKTFNTRFPYITTIVSIGLVTLACGFIIIRYISKYSYYISEDYLVFSRVIGKKRYEILRVARDEIYFIGKEDKIEEEKKPLFNFTVDKNKRYVCKYRREGKEFYFFFSPNEDFLREVKKVVK